MSSVQAVIADYVAGRSGKPPAADPETGGFEIAIDGRYIVQLWEFGGEVVGRVWLGDLSREAGERSHALRHMMEQQLAELGKHDVILGADDKSQELYLHRRIRSAGFCQSDLRDLLQSLVDAVGRYRSSPPPIAAMPMPQMIIRP